MKRRGDRGDMGAEDKRSKLATSKAADAGKDKDALRVGNFKKQVCICHPSSSSTISVRYYAFRWGNGAIEGKLEEDSRLAIFQREWFEGKKALDIGCNSGDFTLEVARRFAPAFIMGIDCDADLITQARTTLKEYISKLAVTEAFREVQKDHGRKDEHHRDDADNDDDEELPLSFRLWKPPAVRFPYNVVFKRENIATDVHTGKDYDVITCLSVTKWIHLYHGDAGIQQLFHLAYALLLPGGYFILEPQKWKSYHNRRDTNETTRAHYDSIALRPSAFSTYLLETVGFRSMTLLKVCSTSAHGFRRPVYLYQK